MKSGVHLTLKIVFEGYSVIDTLLCIMKKGGPLDQSLGDIQGEPYTHIPNIEGHFEVLQGDQFLMGP